MKKKKIYIIGTKILSDMIVEVADRAGYIVAGFFDDIAKEKTFLGKPIFGPVSRAVEKKFLRTGGFVVAVGDNKGRAGLIGKLEKSGATLITLIDPMSVIMPSVTMGKANVFFAHSYIGTRTQIGNGNVFLPGVVVTHHDSIGNYNFFAPGVNVGGNTTIRSFAKFGMNSVIMPHIVVRDDYSCPPRSIVK